VQDVERVETAEAVEYLDEDIPNLFFFEELLLLLLLDDLLVEVAVVEKLHDDAG
jgi:hypothetical protein